MMIGIVGALPPGKLVVGLVLLPTGGVGSLLKGILVGLVLLPTEGVGP